jgi:hypothetical protein
LQAVARVKKKAGEEVNERARVGFFITEKGWSTTENDFQWV